MCPRGALIGAGDRLLHRPASVVQLDARRAERLCRDSGVLGKQTEQQVLGAGVPVMQPPGFLLRAHDHVACRGVNRWNEPFGLGRASSILRKHRVPLLCGLLAHTEDACNLGPGAARSTGVLNPAIEQLVAECDQTLLLLYGRGEQVEIVDFDLTHDGYGSSAMYALAMRGLQIYIESESDEALAAEAARAGTSKAEIIRRLVAEHTEGNGSRDPIGDLVGAFTTEPGDVDEVVYGGRASSTPRSGWPLVSSGQTVERGC